MVTFVLLMLVLPFVSGIFYLWGVVRTGRVSSTLAIVMLLIWPASIYAMVRHWGDEEYDIRVPMLGAYATFSLWLGVWALAPNAHRERVDQQYAPNAFSRAAVEADPVADRLQFAIALANTAYRSGSVDIPAAHATIDVPTHFHFYDRGSLTALYGDSTDGPGERAIGWLVHESVNLADEDEWHIEVAWIGDGFVAEGDLATRKPDTLLALGQKVTESQSAELDEGSSVRLVRFAETPTLDTLLHRATWVEEYAYTEKGEAQNKLDCHAVKLARIGAMLYSINEMDTQRQELCLRSVRLASTRTAFASGQEYDDHSSLFDHRAKYDLAALVTGAIQQGQ
ncbi:MAG: DUF2167 domain-containing protein [Dokdonella sp.]|uniref:DUF2167 domain-containing protein n=1 Tax=Dokdonella sp. TaxID=2291710 RepID=UPI00326689BB